MSEYKALVPFFSKFTSVFSMDPLGTRFLPPADGWNGKTFFVIFQHRQAGMCLVSVYELYRKLLILI